jgi:signal transduction histidine kinase
MQVAPLPENETERLQELYSFELLDTAYDQEFDEIVKLASQICNKPITTLTLIDSAKQWIKAKVGIDVTETDRETAFCSHTILQNEVFEIPDTQLDPRFENHPMVTSGPNVRFYAGVPLHTNNGYNIGSLCVIDSVPGKLTKEQGFALQVLAKQAMKIMEFRVTNKQLQHSLAVQNRIISIVAHDVRNPMASLKSILELKEQDIITTEEADEMLAISSKQLGATIEMVNNLVDWGKLQMKYKKPLKETIPLHSTIENVIATAEIAFSLKNNTFINQVPESLVVTCDNQLVQFLLRNLITNANKFTENGSIAVGAQVADDKFSITVVDTGVGMMETTVANLFNTHKNFAMPGTKDELGSGLGLVLMKEYLDNIGGQITIKSTEGIGTSVTLELPSM